MLEDYEFLKEVGQGNFGRVWQGRRTGTQEIVAIKQISKTRCENTPHMERLLDQEVKAMKTFRHPNIVRLQDKFSDADNVYLVMEFCHGGDLHKYLQNNARLGIEVIRRIMMQLSSAVWELRKKSLMHRDLKPHNILLANSENEPILIKLADFGLAKSTESMAGTICGSPLYMAPEVCRGSRYDVKADMWSIGITLYELVTGTVPFQRGIRYENIMKLKLTFDDSWDPVCRDLCQKLLRLNPIQRISVEEFFNHEFLRSPPGKPVAPLSPARISQVGTHDAKPAPQGQDHAKPVSPDQDQLYPAGFDAAANRLFPAGFDAAAANRLFPAKPVYVYSPTRNTDSPTNSSSRNNGKESPLNARKPPLPKPPRQQSNSSNNDERSYVMVNSPSEVYSVYGISRQPEPLRHQKCSSPGSSKQQGTTGSLESQEKCSSPGWSKQQGTTGSLEPQEFRVRELSVCAHVLHELASFKFLEREYTKALSVQLMALAALLQARNITSDSTSEADQIEKKMVEAVAHAEKMSSRIESQRGLHNTMPDAAEIIYEAAISAAKSAASEDIMDRYDVASIEYSKALTLFFFLIMEDSPARLPPQGVEVVRKLFNAVEFYRRECRKKR